MNEVVSVDPFRCRVWSLHDRLEEHISEGTCRAEIQSFEQHGQRIPALGRPVRGEPGCDIEIIYGARRLFVARHIGKPLLVEVRELSDQQAIVAMDMENRQRKDISPYERGLSYARWLRAGHFGSQDEIARALNVSASQVSRMLKLARLPSVIVNAFGNAAEICEGWGVELADLLEEPSNRRLVVRKAREIIADSRRMPAREVYRHLRTASVPGRKPRTQARDSIIKARDGSTLFRIRRQTTSIVLVMPAERISAELLARVQVAVTGILESKEFPTLKIQRARTDPTAIHHELT